MGDSWSDWQNDWNRWATKCWWPIIDPRNTRSKWHLVGAKTSWKLNDSSSPLMKVWWILLCCQLWSHVSVYASIPLIVTLFNNLRLFVLFFDFLSHQRLLPLAFFKYIFYMFPCVCDVLLLYILLAFHKNMKEKPKTRVKYFKESQFLLLLWIWFWDVRKTNVYLAFDVCDLEVFLCIL